MRNNLILAFVLFLFLVSRIYKIAEIPVSVYWDEASIGYNAFSVATDLKDEWGDKLPLHFRAFGEFKLPVYIYSVAVFVKLIGLNEYAVRLPAVLYSLGTLIIVYLLVKKITERDGPAILSTFILSFSPWFFIFSRTGYEATAGLFFFFLATYLFFLIDKSKYLLPVLMVGFILSFYSYNSFRIIIPIWLAILFIYKFHNTIALRKNWLPILISVLLFGVSLIPVYRLYKYDSGGARFAQVEITKKKDFVKNYFSHFSPKFLFTTGDTNPRSQIPGHGQLYWFELPLILVGVFAIFRSKKLFYFIPLVILLLAPIPAALTKESPHALRALLAAPSFAIISAFGVFFLKDNFKKFGVVILSAVVIAYYLFFEFYIQDYIVRYPKQSASAWQFEYKQIFEKQRSGFVTDRYAQPYIFALYYLKYPPEKFREEVKLNPVGNWGFSKVASFDGFQFTNR
ncbi:MAG: glycosyltransferase family 39 protein [Candidatus Woesebacteria bacterium]|nr:MAG: glycosyltransferase family 39 protein [Candidatus Woesebacteria bacterium]